MHYSTCTNCAVDPKTCERRQEISEAIKGHGFLSIKFKCPDRHPMFRPGQRVAFDWSQWEDDDELELTFHGTVLREVKNKFVVQVDSGPDADGEGIEASDVFTRNDVLLVKVRPVDMRRLQEENRRVCQTCSAVEGVSENRCYASEYFRNPADCILPTTQPTGE